MALSELKYVEGDVVSNRARYWVYRAVNERGLRWSDLKSDNVSTKTFWNFCKDQREIRLSKLAAIAEVLEIDIRDLFLPTPEELALGSAAFEVNKPR